MSTLSQHARRLLVVGPLALLMALACQAVQPPPPVPTATPEVLADCFFSADPFAWVDTNGNGLREDNEPPLEGVEVSFSLTFLGSATTGPDGTAHVSGMYPSACDPALENSLVAVAPEGYAPTTALILPYSDARETYTYGFQPMNP